MTQFNMIQSPEGPDPKRLILAVIATSAVLILYSYFFAPAPMPPQDEAQVVDKQPEKKEPPKEESISKTDDLGQEKKHKLATPHDIDVVKKTFSIKEDYSGPSKKRSSYEVTFSSRGGVIDSYSLTDFSKNVKLFDRKSLSSTPLTLLSRDKKHPVNGETKYKLDSIDKKSIVFSYIRSDGLKINRHYHLKNNAAIDETITLKNIGNNPIKVDITLLAQKLGDDTGGGSFLTPGSQSDSVVIKTQDEHKKFAYSDLLDESKIYDRAQYIGFDDQFFLSVLALNYGQNISKIIAKAQETGDDIKAFIEIDLKDKILSADEAMSLSNRFYLGPKQIDLLSQFTPPLDENIDFGWFGVLSRPMLWLLVKIYNFVLNYGLAIIIITLLIKLLIFPLTHKQFKSTQEMKKIQPKLKEIQKKYSHDRTLLGQKQMELYKEYGINPLAGCLPMLIQLPIWFALLQMLRNSVELFDQPFYLWIQDLTNPDPYFVLPILMGASMFIQQLFMPTPNDQPQMKYVMMVLPLFLTFVMLNMPSGLSLYILTNNLLTILQQAIIKRSTEKTA